MLSRFPIKASLFSLFFYFFPAQVAYGALPTEELVQQYREMHRTLAQDDVAAAKIAAQRLIPVLKQWLSEGEAEGQNPEVKEMMKATQEFTAFTVDKDIRVGFGNISRAFVAFVRKSSELKSRLQLFFCPMFPQGYAYWVQLKAEGLTNPYWGHKMLTCGVKKVW